MCGEFHVLALDQRGHGDSAWAKDGAYTIDDHASDIDHLMLDAVVLIGLSVGGRNALMFAAIHPGKVEKLVIVNIGPDIDPRGAVTSPTSPFSVIFSLLARWLAPETSTPDPPLTLSRRSWPSGVTSSWDREVCLSSGGEPAARRCPRHHRCQLPPAPLS
jgi:pimeloyl-ACP methyl ester carboxylesterase